MTVKGEAPTEAELRQAEKIEAFIEAIEKQRRSAGICRDVTPS